MGDTDRKLNRDPGRVVHVLTGCTAVGKTEWALRWAEENGAEILSCDSLLFYRGMDIGTAKPSALDLARVRHHLVDIRDVSEPMNAAMYAGLARQAAEEIRSRGKAVLVAGGSGFYLRSFFAPVSDGIDVPADVRLGIASRLESRGLAALVSELAALNPEGLGDLDRANPRRVSSALGRCLASGRTLAELKRDFAGAKSTFADWEIRLTRLDLPREALEPRIRARVDTMLASGLVEEVRGLLPRGLGGNPSASRAIGYRETIAALEGRLPMSDLAGAIAADTRALVKKQRTWFRTQLPRHRVVDPTSLGGAAGLFLG